MDKNQTISVTEVHDGIHNIGSQTIYMLGQTTQIIYDYDEDQYIVYNPSKSLCLYGVRVSVTFHLTRVNIILNSVWIAD